MRWTTPQAIIIGILALIFTPFALPTFVGVAVLLSLELLFYRGAGPLVYFCAMNLAMLQGYLSSTYRGCRLVYGNPPKEIGMSLNTIEEAIEEIKAGKVVIVVDDEDRENEGDFVAAASKVSPEIINFMATEGRGLICTPILPARAAELDLPPMVNNNSDPNKTAFTVSIDRIGGLYYRN